MDYYTKDLNNQQSGFKSKLEFIFSRFLDFNEIEGIYEPETFQLGNSKYTPDFYLPKANQYIELKPRLSFSNTYLYKKFCYTFMPQNKFDFLIICPDEWSFWEYWKSNQITDHDKEISKLFWIQESIEAGLETMEIPICSNCGKSCFTPPYGSWGCRCCGFCNGDHNQKRAMNFSDFYKQQYRIEHDVSLLL